MKRRRKKKGKEQDNIDTISSLIFLLSTSCFCLGLATLFFSFLSLFLLKVLFGFFLTFFYPYSYTVKKWFHPMAYFIWIICLSRADKIMREGAGGRGLDDNSSFESLQCTWVICTHWRKSMYRVAAGTPAPTDPTHDESTDSRDNYTFFLSAPYHLR